MLFIGLLLTLISSLFPIIPTQKTVPYAVNLAVSSLGQQEIGDSYVLGASKVVAVPAMAESRKTPIPSETEPTLISQQIYLALNAYRAKKGSSPLKWDARLADFAGTRAKQLLSLGALDNHAGFKSFINTQDGLAKLGFSSMGENSSWASSIPSPESLIENQYASDPPHDSNQLNPGWQYVGVGIAGNYTDLVFGGKR